MADNHHVHISSSSASCGLLELSGLTSDPEKILFALANYLYHPSKGTPAAFALWSDTKESNGIKLKDYTIKEFKMVQGTNWVINPKTSNEICVWVWEIPHTKFKEWYKQKRVEKASQV
jgi:hypothetical protein